MIYFTRDDMSEVSKDNTFAFIALYLFSYGISRFCFNDNQNISNQSYTFE